jgi:hypothetical protein
MIFRIALLGRIIGNTIQGNERTWTEAASRHGICTALWTFHPGGGNVAMWRRVGARQGVRLRDAVVVLTLFSHLMVTVGFPMPVSPATKAKDASRPFPCQHRPCGCRTADQCWKGDCCCFTLEEKLAWAAANGIEPPDHVRPLVEARKARSSPVAQKKHPGCCSEADQDEGVPPTATTPSCCSQSGARWVVGIFAQKCHGEGPAGLMTLDPSVPPDTDSRPLAVPEPGEFIAVFHTLLCSSTHSPPTPPPRRS